MNVSLSFVHMFVLSVMVTSLPIADGIARSPSVGPSVGRRRPPDHISCHERALARASDVSVSPSATPSATADDVTITGNKMVDQIYFWIVSLVLFLASKKERSKKRRDHNWFAENRF